MQQDKVSMYLMTNSKFFPPEKIFTIQERLKSIDDNKMSAVFSLELKDPTTFLIVSIFGGWLGIDRFMLGDIGMGMLKLLTCGGGGILTFLIISMLGGWLDIDHFMLMRTLRLLTYGGGGILTIIDWCLIQSRVKEFNFNMLMMWI